MAKTSKEHEFGTADSSQQEYAFGAFIRFWKYTFALAVVVAIFFVILAGK